MIGKVTQKMFGLYHQDIIETESRKPLQIQDDTLSGSRWWLPSPGTFVNKLNINPKHFLSFQKPTLRPELSKQAGIHTLCSEHEPVNHPVKLLSRVRLFKTPWTVAYQAPPSMEFSRQDYWRGMPFPSPVQSMTLT